MNIYQRHHRLSQTAFDITYFMSLRFHKKSYVVERLYFLKIIHDLQEFQVSLLKILALREHAPLSFPNDMCLFWLMTE